MHLLATTSGVIDGAAEAIDLNQSPADVVVLSAADSELAALARAHDVVGGPTLRLANLLQLQHNLSVDLYAGKTLGKARLIVLRVLGGASYWRYGLDQVEALAKQIGIKLCVLPGDTQPDPELTSRSTLSANHCERLRQYLVTGGAENAERFIAYCGHLLDGAAAPQPATPFPKAGVYRNTSALDRPLAAITFYRSVVEGALTAPIDAIIDALDRRSIGCIAFYVASLKDETSATVIREHLAQRGPDVILNATSFAISSGGGGDPLSIYDCPVLQVVLAGSSEENWLAGSHGLGPRDLAMNVVLPELDGRIMSRAISFKADTVWHETTQCRIVTYKPVPDRVEFAADLAANWVGLRITPAKDRKLAIVLANYPNKDGRIANGVGYDTPASTVAILDALKGDGYTVASYPKTGNGIIEDLQRGTTNAALREGPGLSLLLTDYQIQFNALPQSIRTQITTRWGEPGRDPYFRDGAFHLPIRLYGNAAIAIQPARGYNVDPKSTYHDPALVPPHGYLAFYFWLRHNFGAQAIIHNGKHGNLEWLPGKANALSAECYPEIALGPLPQLYPFIVNDPGEGTQAKRRTGAVIVDHLTPPLTRAETYGPLKDLEALVDEYYLASGLDRRRLAALKKDILDLTRSHRLDLDAGLTGDEDSDLQRLDAYLCDLKEAQIRDGLHILGSSPEGRLETDLLVALTRVPRGTGEGGDQSLIRALSADFGFADFDPLTCEMAKPWTGAKPRPLQDVSPDPWRTNGDTVERLELFAASLVPAGECSSEVIGAIRDFIQPALRASGPTEIEAVLKGLAGRFVAPGPSGAPTRGRLDVLPTGRNF